MQFSDREILEYSHRYRTPDRGDESHNLEEESRIGTTCVPEAAKRRMGSIVLINAVRRLVD